MVTILSPLPRGGGGPARSRRELGRHRVRTEGEVRPDLRPGGERSEAGQSVVTVGGEPGGRVGQGGGRPGERVRPPAWVQALPGQDGGREGLLGEDWVHLRRSGLQRRPVVMVVSRARTRPGRGQPGRDGWGRGEVSGRQRRSLSHRLTGLGGEGRRLAGREGRERHDGGGDLHVVVRQDDDVLDGVGQAGVALPGTGLVAGSDRGADRGLLEHRHGRPEAGTDEGRPVLLALTAADLGERVGVVLARQSPRSDAGRLQAQARPLPLVAAPLDSVGISRLNLDGARPEKIADLDGKM